MDANPDVRLVARSKVLASALGLGVGVLGVLVLFGWVVDSPMLKGIIPAIGTTMKPITAISFVLSGLSLWLSQEGRGERPRRWAIRFALAVTLLGGAGMAEYLLGARLGTGRILDLEAGLGQMSPATTVGFLSAGASLALLDVTILGGRRPAQFFACLCGAIGFLALTAYAYRAEFLVNAENHRQIAIHTSFGFLALAAGLLLARPEGGCMNVAISASTAGRLFRRMAPAVFLIPMVLGWVRLEGESHGLYGPRTGVAFMVLGTTTLLFALLWGSTIQTQRMETQRKGALRAQASAEEKAKILMEMTGSGMGLVDFEGRIREVNQRWERIFGLDRTEIIGRNALDLMAPKDRPYLETRFRKLAVGEQPAPAEWEIHRPDGASVVVESFPARVEIGGAPFMIVALNDITERKRMRQQAVLSEKLATVGTLAAGLVHEINNPTTAVMANLEVMGDLLQRDGLELSPAEVAHLRAITERAFQASLRIREIVGSVKGFARADAEDLTVCDVHSLLDAAAVMAAHETKRKARVEKDYAQGLPSIPANGGRLQQLFVNLIINAAQAMDEDPEKNRIVLRTRPKEDHICVEIEDTGSGIPKELLPKIFDPFFTTKPEGVGTGLGLPICHEIVRQHGGEITVESEVRKGTRFTLTLSRFTGPEHLPERRMPDPALPKLLLVDDDSLVLAALRRNLMRSFHVVTAQGGRAAIEILENEAIQAVATDLHMPEVNGVDLYRHIEQAFPHLRQSVIFFSGGAPDPKSHQFLMASGLTCLSKPFVAADLERHLGKSLPAKTGFDAGSTQWP